MAHNSVPSKLRTDVLSSSGNKWLIVIGILAVVGLGFLVFSNVTGSVISGSVVMQVIDEGCFRISEFGDSKLNEEVEDNGEDSGGSE
jgi:divalent metal cation (Fe/Co/Zn/Cd) transporter